MKKARGDGKPILFGCGAHVIKVGLQPVLIDLMERGFVQGLALNGAGIIHDFEIAFAGRTSEDVGAQILDGRFGAARETGEYLNRAIREGVADGLGLGASVGRMIAGSRFPHRKLSLLAAGHRLGIPVTVHVALGTDIIHFHPGADGAAIGEGSLRDFFTFASLVGGLDGGVYINVGSAVMLPEVFLKAVSFARNKGARLDRMTTAVFDFNRHYRPDENVVRRPVGEEGERVLLHRRPRDHDPALRRRAEDLKSPGVGSRPSAALGARPVSSSCVERLRMTVRPELFLHDARAIADGLSRGQRRSGRVSKPGILPELRRTTGGSRLPAVLELLVPDEHGIDTLGPVDRLGQRPGGVDHVVGATGLFRLRHLGPDLPEGFVPADPVPGHQAREPDVLAAGNDDDPVEERREPGFEDQGGLRDEDPAAADPPLFRGDLADPVEHPGVDDAVQRRPGRRVGEDDGAQLLPVDGPVGGEDAVPEPGDDGRVGSSVRGHQLVGGPVGGMDATALLAEDRGDDGLAAGDPSREGDGEHGAISSSFRG